MLNMIEAFSKAKEYWEVGFAVKASNLSKYQRSQARAEVNDD